MLVEKLVARLVAKDTEALARLFDDEVVWWSPLIPGAPWPTHVRSAREVESYFLAYLSVFELTRMTVRHLLVDRGHAVLVGRAQGRVAASGREFSNHFAMMLSVRSGRIVELRMFEDSLAIAGALTPSPGG
ncbi:nuclear transport factor 2 family protein, partial [Allokutzneria albata]|uniref:SnoaL-like domain-containing protein n=1 Tax=Allokutzneria albata TaxID=211114 RepID=A0A1G9V8F3_ALLAB